MTTETNKLEYDVTIIGAGPSGLATAIHLKQLALENNLNLSICILEKGAYVGAHILSGAIFESDTLEDLIPDWKNQGAPVNTKVTQDKFYFLTKNKKFNLPVPSILKNSNKNNYIISLSNLCKWLATKAEAMGIEIFPGFPAKDLIIENKKIHGVYTAEMGLDKNGRKTNQYQPAVAIYAKQIVLAEGCRGSLSKKIIKLFNLDKNSCPQTYGLGIKEIWQIDPKLHQLGLVEHSLGWPLKYNTYGGSFIYHIENNKIAYGFITGLDYSNPYLSPFEESQRFKLHPAIKPLFENATRISYGARALCEGGIQSLPNLTFPGGLIVGDSAGFLNVAKLKGSHNAIRSGMIAAKSLLNYFTKNSQNNNNNNIYGNEIKNYQENINNSIILKELKKIRNIRPSFKYNIYLGLLYSALDNYILNGRAPWTFKHKPDHKSLHKTSEKIIYPKPDNKITFDRLSSVYLSNTHHNEDQQSHLKIIESSIPIKINYEIYHGPEQYYCPAAVYEYQLDSNNQRYLQINFQNCVHCKTCDIKDPRQNINWTVPEGGGGPNYTDM